MRLVDSMDTKLQVQSVIVSTIAPEFELPGRVQ